METEKTYLDGLTAMIDLYLKPLQEMLHPTKPVKSSFLGKKDPIVDQEQWKTMFGGKFSLGKIQKKSQKILF